MIDYMAITQELFNEYRWNAFTGDIEIVKKGENMTREMKEAQENIIKITQRKALKMTSREILKDDIEWAEA